MNEVITQIYAVKTFKSEAVPHQPPSARHRSSAPLARYIAAAHKPASAIGDEV